MKSMQNIFTKINEDIKSLDIDGSAATSGGGGHETPPTAGKKRARGTFYRGKCCAESVRMMVANKGPLSGPAKNAKTKKTPGHVPETKEEESDAGNLATATYSEPALKKRAVTRK